MFKRKSTSVSQLGEWPHATKRILKGGRHNLLKGEQRLVKRGHAFTFKGKSLHELLKEVGAGHARRLGEGGSCSTL